MSPRSLAIAIVVLLALAGAAFGGFWYATRHAMQAAEPHSGAPQPGAAHQADDRKVLYWHDPMNPQHRFDKPGKSPFMDMDLVPVYAGDVQAGGGIRIDPAVTQSLGVRTAAAALKRVAQQIDTLGTVEADERRITVLQSRAAGWLEKLHLRAVNDRVQRGQPVAEVYAPDLLAAQEEYLLVRKSGSDDLAQAARQRLSLLGLTEAQIRALENLQEPTRRVILHAPTSGVVTELGAREGAAVSPGMPVASIVDLSRVWIVAQVPEAQLGQVATGQKAVATLAAMPGSRYQGEVEYVYPEIDPQTRTVRVRFSVKNAGLKLRPGMIANVTIHGSAGKQVLVVPSEAVIRTGARTVVLVDEGDGRFRSQEVALGSATGDQTEIREGLRAGEHVVVSGQFLIDSEASLKGAIARLDAGSDAQHAAHSGEHVAQGTVQSADPAAGKVVIAHGPVSSLDWPAMTMGFMVKDKALLQSLKAGEEFEFRFVPVEGGYAITAVQPQRKGDRR
jgi:Cu(I)/Ag(I) efflux system membrane fusion protein